MNVDLTILNDETSRSNFFKYLRLQCKGMMNASVYDKLAEWAGSIGDGNIVEIGTSRGASAISCAIGMKANMKRGKVYTHDKYFGGSWGGSEIDKHNNFELVKKNVSIFNVVENCQLIMTSATHPIELLDGQKIDMLVLDADGKIDRDLKNFQKYFSKCMMIVIDDYENLIRLIGDAKGKWKVCFKKKMTWDALNYLISHDVIVKKDVVFGTFFGVLNVDVLTEDHFKKLSEILKSSSAINAMGTNYKVLYDAALEESSEVAFLRSKRFDSFLCSIAEENNIKVESSIQGCFKDVVFTFERKIDKELMKNSA